MINEVELQDLVAKHIKIDKGENMSKYNYELNTLYNDNFYAELLEVYNNFDIENILNESIMSIPVNKVKDMLKKIATIKNDKQMESFVNKHKKLVRPEKELKQKVMKLAKQLNFEEKEVKEAGLSVMKTLAAISQFSVLSVILGIPIMIIMLINAKVKKQPLKEVAKQTARDIEKSINSAKKGPYTSSLNFTIYGVLFFIGSYITYLISLMVGGGALISAAIGSFVLVALVLLILSSISFMWTFLGTPGRMMRGE